MQINIIEVEGLWSYREAQRIDISGQPLVVGVGQNGAGKSALLVGAIVVAFYGKFPTRTVEESITTGASQAKVAVEFEINGTDYRITRTYPRTKSGSGQVSVADSSKKSGWRPVTESGLREVNDYIINLLGMDYETATMTWIAEQGQYGKFSAAQPANRFKLLSTIFGLDEYGPKAAAAAAQVKRASDEVTTLDGRIAELSGELYREDDDTPPTGIAALDDTELTAKSDALHAEIDRVGEALADLNSGDPGRKTVEARQAYELVNSTRVGRLNTASDSRARATRTIDQARERAAIARKNADTRFEATVQGTRRQTAQTRERGAHARRDAQNALSRIAAAARDLPGYADQVTAYRDASLTARADAQRATEEITAHRARHAALKADWETHKQSILDARARIALLEHTAADTDHASCFACGQHLNAADALALIESQRRDITANSQTMAKLRAGAIAEAETADRLEATRDQLLTQAHQHDQNGAVAARRVADLEAIIATREEKEAAERAAVEMIASAGHDETELLAAATREHTQAMAAAGAEETATVTEADAELAIAVQVIGETSEPTSNETKLKAALDKAVALVADEAEAINDQRTTLSIERETLRREAHDYSTEIGRREEQLANRNAQTSRLEGVHAQRAAAVADRTLHQTLQKAYSPTGIPAMVLAGVIEQLNETVNANLQSLSRGELSISLKTARETSKGAAENKVTVYVDTADGTRAYETLSGGQKFRVDLALRTGLAATIARGTGTPIRTFILDEGWGTLDEKGILSTIDTLFRLSEETSVLTVSHIDSVRDAFPARVEVSIAGGTSVAELVSA